MYKGSTTHGLTN